MPDGRADVDYVASKMTVVDLEKEEVVNTINLVNGAEAMRGVCISFDGKYIYATHLMARQAGELVAYARWYSEGGRAVLGRIVTLARGRGKGWGRIVVAAAMEVLPFQDIEVNAQAHLERFYESFGFVTQGEPVVEDGIPHIRMLRAGNLVRAPL